MKREVVSDLIDRSSLGTPEVKALRYRTPNEVVKKVLLKSDDRAGADLRAGREVKKG